MFLLRHHISPRSCFKALTHQRCCRKCECLCIGGRAASRLSCSSVNLLILSQTGILRQRIPWGTLGHFGIHLLNYGIWLRTCLHQLPDRQQIRVSFRSEVSAAARQTFWMICLLLFSQSAPTARRIANLQCHEKLKNDFARGRRYPANYKAAAVA